MRQPFHSGDFSPTTSPGSASLWACSQALGQLRGQGGEAWLWAPGRLEDQLPGVPSRLQAPHHPQAGKWFLLNPPKGSMRRKESPSPPADHRLTRASVPGPDGYHLTKILTPGHSQPLLCSLGPESKNQSVPAKVVLTLVLLQHF